jgi:hypothetical protein
VVLILLLSLLLHVVRTHRDERKLFVDIKYREI